MSSLKEIIGLMSSHAMQMSDRKFRTIFLAASFLSLTKNYMFEVFLMADYSCFFCKYFVHLNPDDDYCTFQDKIVTIFTPVCPCFIKVGESCSINDGVF